MHWLMLTIPLLSAQEPCRYTAQRDATMDAAGGARVFVSSGAGRLRIEGKAGLRQARIRGTACASDPELLDDIRLQTGRTGSELRVEATDWDIELRSREYARLDLVIEVPQDFDARVVDGAGHAELLGLGDLWIEDGSGDLVVRDLAGSLEIQDGSGSMRIYRVSGDVTVDDNSGDIGINDVGGSVQITDGSGNISVSEVMQHVNIADSAGDIIVTNVGGDFTIECDGSGNVKHRGVKGRVSYDGEDQPYRKRNRAVLPRFFGLS